MKNTQTEHSLSGIHLDWLNFIDKLNPYQKSLFVKLDEIGQLHILSKIDFNSEHAEALVHELEDIEEFFKPLGGLKGYQEALITTKNPAPFDQKILNAPHILIDDGICDHLESVYSLIKNLPLMAEVYALGGAADRLNLKSGDHMLPAACLKIAGKTLVEYLIQDLEAKEWLYYKIYHETLTIPCVMMTSFEKDNQAHIFNILKEHDFFHRPKDRFLIFHQPLVPMVDENLKWQTQKGSQLFLKPGGHGAIWGLCLKEGVFDTLKSMGVKKLSIRQINNPIACIDFGHSAFLGYGFSKNAQFGFFACERFAGSQEGINVLLQDQNQAYCLTNIEYCQLKTVGINDKPNSEGLSIFPANTNVLFADLDTLSKLSKTHPLPGKILNYKTFALDGSIKPLARLETMMQNMADYIKEDSPRLQKTYMTLSPRVKTISPVKKQKIPGSSYEETPQACFFDFMKNAEELLHLCGIEHTPLGTLEEFYKSPVFVFLYLPALGPYFDLIAQKLKRGYLAKRAYLELNIAEVCMSGLNLKGALKIQSKNPYGFSNKNRTFSEKCGRVHIENCVFENLGVDYENSQNIYQDKVVYFEKCEIILEGFSEFKASGITFKGTYRFVVPDGCRLEVRENEYGKLEYHTEKITHPGWTSSYVTGKDRLLIQKSNP
jgi:UDP-N-acetylglucosamine pyrophosphorylase